jgi:hypothetical protein
MDRPNADGAFFAYNTVFPNTYKMAAWASETSAYVFVFKLSERIIYGEKK